MKNYILYIVIIVLVFIIFLKQCRPPVQSPPKEILITRTFHVHDTIPGPPSILINTIHDTTWIDSSKYHPATDYVGLLKQYDELGNKYFSKYLYKTPYKLGKYGTATVVDTVVQNYITGSSLSYDITFKDTVKITLPSEPKVRQVYIGGNLFLSNKEINSLYGGLIYKDRKDNIYQLNLGINTSGNTLIGAGLYYKIKL